MKRTIKYLYIALPLLAFFAGCTTMDRYGELTNPYKVAAEASLSTFEWPGGLEENRRSDIYKVTIVQGFKRVEIPVFINRCPEYVAGHEGMVDNDRIPMDRYKGNSISWASFSFDGEVTVEVEVLDAGKVPVSDAVRVIPTRYGIVPHRSGNIVSFTMTDPGQCSVEIGTNGYKNGLIIFADPMETAPVANNAMGWVFMDQALGADIAAIPAGTENVYFKAGVHDIGVWHVPTSVKNIYFENGVWVYGAIRMNGSSNVKIYGRGVLSSDHLDYRESHCIEAVNGSHITLEGITVADPRYFSIRLIAPDCNVSWTKVIGGWTYNCDGIVAYDRSHVHHCFTWANDDNIKIYMPEVRFEDMVLWQLNNGGAIQLGWYNANGQSIRVRRVDLLHADWNNFESNNRGVISFVGNKPSGYPADPNSVTWQKDLLIEDLVTETAVPFIFRVAPTRYEPTVTPAYVYGFTMKNWNIKVNTPYAENQITGVSDDWWMTGFVFDNVYINSIKMTSDHWNANTFKFKTEFMEAPTFQ